MLTHTCCTHTHILHTHTQRRTRTMAKANLLLMPAGRANSYFTNCAYDMLNGAHPRPARQANTHTHTWKQAHTHMETGTHTHSCSQAKLVKSALSGHSYYCSPCASFCCCCCCCSFCCCCWCLMHALAIIQLLFTHTHSQRAK